MWDFENNKGIIMESDILCDWEVYRYRVFIWNLGDVRWVFGRSGILDESFNMRGLEIRKRVVYGRSWKILLLRNDEGVIVI